MSAAQTPCAWSCWHHPAQAFHGPFWEQQIGAIRRETNTASWPGSSLLPFPGKCVCSPWQGKCHFSLPSHQKHLCVLYLCLSEAPSPPSTKGIQIHSGFKSCKEDFGTESSRNPHPAGNHTWNCGKYYCRGGRRDKCWRALQCMQRRKISRLQFKISLAASISLGMTFGCSGWGCVDASRSQHR